MITPTVNIEELEKKIAELKAVETWLNMNVGFVQMTIKTLEMQKSSAREPARRWRRRRPSRPGQKS
jgi:hypothetical protein